ncbi:TonB-linked outer membrane protein, SusC/RagA family [Mucilaginibacter mallensis]|uniref:TonB-linked outer membrane protein, SusC/RagA family n=2 Tax=Mucilaginibacter mallensis TaxID=652787 RepID=A0A1H1X5I6_MUCMA|nr:TonB-linked outer membrane protein, SusC/RagA family [Mucilaginibacter mallensis]
MDKNLQKRMRYCISLFIASMLLCLSGYAQTIGISGKVTTSEKSEPIPGVTIRIKGSETAVASVTDGTYKIMAKPGDILVFSFLGYERQEITVKNNNTINVKLNPTSSDLNEVVVIGYGKIPKKDLTGSVSSIKGTDLRQTQPTTFDQALQGKVAGVVIQQISGQPGGGVSIQIRGVSSITGSNSPLVVIDGVLIPPSSDPGNGGNPLNSINPADIETIDVLKDASATAIYGSQATNGVIVITTKRGKIGAPTITYDGYTEQQLRPKELPTMNLQQYATVINARSAVWGFTTDAAELANPQYLGAGTDWQKALFQNAPEQSHTLTISGGNEKNLYLISSTYFNQQGIVAGSDFTRYSVRVNLDNKPADWLKMGTSLQLIHSKQNQNTTANGGISNVLSETPNIPVQYPNGSYGGNTNTQGWVSSVANPVAISLITTNNQTRNQVFANQYFEIKFTKDLSFRTEASGNFDFNGNNTFSPTYNFGTSVNGTNGGGQGLSEDISWTFRNFLTYDHNFNKLKINVLAGHEATSDWNESVSANRTNFPSNDVISVSAGDPVSATNSGNIGLGGSTESYFSRLNLSWDDKYLITGNIRNDGSSNFPANNRWALTYSGAFAWKINNEVFFKNVKQISELKLRLSYGLTNNQNVPGNSYVGLLSTQVNGLGTTEFQTQLPNPKIKWEQTDYYDAGLDASFFNGRFSLTFDVYDRITNGLLLKEPLPIYSGTTTGYSPGAMSAPYANVGSMRNSGFDFQISSTNIRSKDFYWRSDFTLSRNVNKVLSLGNGGSDASLSVTDGGSGQVAEKTVVGQPIGEFYGYVFDGVFATPKDFQTHALPANQAGVPYPISPNAGGIWYGDRMYKDLNGDGIVDSRDETFLGSPIPKFQYGIGNTVTYKKFELNIFFTGDYGNKVYNEVSESHTDPTQTTAWFTSVLNYSRLAMINPNGSASDVNNVYVTNPNTNIVSLRNDNTNENNRPSSIYIQNGSFLKCKNITLSYNMTDGILSRIHVHSMRVYANVTNVFTITKYVGMDPEIGSWNPLQAGWDQGYYPQPRGFTIGANITLDK